MLDGFTVRPVSGRNKYQKRLVISFTYVYCGLEVAGIVTVDFLVFAKGFGPLYILTSRAFWSIEFNFEAWV